MGLSNTKPARPARYSSSEDEITETTVSTAGSSTDPQISLSDPQDESHDEPDHEDNEGDDHGLPDTIPERIPHGKSTPRTDPAHEDIIHEIQNDPNLRNKIMLRVPELAPNADMIKRFAHENPKICEDFILEHPDLIAKIHQMTDQDAALLVRLKTDPRKTLKEFFIDPSPEEVVASAADLIHNHPRLVHYFCLHAHHGMLNDLQNQIKRTFQLENWTGQHGDTLGIGTHQRITFNRLLEPDFRSYRLRLMAGLENGSFTNPRYVEIAHYLHTGRSLGLLAPDFGWPHVPLNPPIAPQNGPAARNPIPARAAPQN